MSDKDSSSDAAGKEVKGEQSAKMVPESDLLAVKEGAKKEVERLQETFNAQLSEVKLAKSTAENQLFEARASAKKLEETLANHNAVVLELNTTKKSLTDLQEKSKKLETDTLEAKKSILSNNYGIKRELLDTKTSEQLTLMEEALVAANVKGRGAGSYDLGGSGRGATPVKLSPIDQAKEDLKHATIAGGKEKYLT
jgi:hypothetical protein